MAGDWIPFDKDLPHKLEVLRIASLTGRPRREVVCILMEFWAWADGQTDSGTLPGFSVPLLSASQADTDAQFWHAVCAVGWLAEFEGGLRIPNFEVWMGRSAKKRLKDTRRRQSNRQGGTPCPLRKRTKAALQADKSGTTGQDRRVKNNTPPPPKGGERFNPASLPLPHEIDTPTFREAWQRWCAYRAERKPKLGPVGAQQQLTALAKAGEAEAIERIDRAIQNTWQGLFFRDEKQAGPRLEFGEAFDAELARLEDRK